MIYLLPEPSSVNDEVAQLCTAAAVRFLFAKKIRDIILAGEESGIVVVRVKESMVRPLSAYVEELFEELPFLVFRAPDSNYSTVWMQTFDAYPSVDWKELSAQLAKTGLLSSTPEAAQKIADTRRPMVDVEAESAKSSAKDREVGRSYTQDHKITPDVDGDLP